MNIYIEYKSYSFFKKAYQAVVDNTGKEVSKGYVIDYKGGGSMTENIDKAGGEGTGAFAKQVIDFYTQKLL